MGFLKTLGVGFLVFVAIAIICAVFKWVEKEHPWIFGGLVVVSGVLLSCFLLGYLTLAVLTLMGSS
jgi:hypothetical protein